MSVEIGEKVQDFSLPATGDDKVSLSDFQGRKVVVYFYPRDNTPGCTQEGQDFRDLYDQFQVSGAEILGISRDTVAAHEKFRAKYDFPFELLSDKYETVCGLFDVMKEKKMYGKDHRGIERSTFLIDEQGVLRDAWRGVKVKDHAQAVLDKVKAL